MGDANQNSRGQSNMKGKQEKKNGKPSWWALKAKKQRVKKKLKGKAAKSDSKHALNDQLASMKVNVLSKKENVGQAPSAGLNVEPGAPPTSKQARKRKLKRQAKLLQKLERKQNSQSKETIKVAKDKDLDRTDRQLKRRKRRFKRKRQREAEKAGKTELLVKENETNVDVDREEMGGNGEVRTSKRKETKDVEKIKRKRKRKNDDFSEPVKKLQKVEKEGKKTTHTSGDKSHESDASPDIDKNWKNLMKSINYQPLARKKKASKGKDSKPEIWFDDVDPELVETQDPAKLPLDQSNLHAGKQNPDPLTKHSESAGLTKYVGLDCEMVGIGPDGKENMLARVSIVNQHGLCIYDKFVAPQEDVTNYRTKVTGISAQDLKNADSFSSVQAEVSRILKGRILVGHALQNDLKVLLLTHPKSMIRDTSTYQKFKDMSKGTKPKLKKLCEMLLKVPIQQGVHNSVQDAQAAMKLFMLHRIDWEKELHKQHHRKPKIKTTKGAEALISTSND